MRSWVLLVAFAACSNQTRPGVRADVNGDAGGGGGNGGNAADAGPSVVTNGQTISTQAGLYEVETDIAASASGVLAVVFMAQGPGNVGYTFSKDEGATWSPPAAILPPANSQLVDPSIAADGSGGFLLTYLSIGSSGRHVYAAVAQPGATAFGAPVEVSDAAVPSDYDKPWALVLADGTRAIVFSHDTGNTIHVAKSADGTAWSRAAIAPDGTLRGVPFACASGARMYVTYLVPGGVQLAASDDGGATWPAANTTSIPGSGERPAFDMPTCAADGSDVWVAYGLTNDANTVARADELTAIRVARSSDGGKTIAARATLPETGHMMHPRIARDGKGVLHVLSYAGKSAGDRAARVHHARSLDRGVAWTQPDLVGAPMTFETSRTGLGWLGDYAGVATRDGRLYATFVQNQDGGGSVSHVSFARIDPPP